MQNQLCDRQRERTPGGTTPSRSPIRVWTYDLPAVIAFSLFALATATPVRGADDAAASFPQRPVRMLVGFAAGGATDIIARIVAEKLSAQWRQSVVVENRPGASGMIGGEVLAKASKDGYIIGMQSVTQTILPAMTPKIPYDIVRDFTPLGVAANVPFILIVGASPKLAAAKTIQDIVAAARTAPKHLAYGSAGAGTMPQLAAEIFRALAKIDVVHVPFKGGGQAVTDVVGGQVDYMFANAPEVVGFIKGGRLRPIAVTSPKRLALFPEVPAVAESMQGLDVVQWYAFFGPAGLRAPTLRKLNSSLLDVLRQPEVTTRFDAMAIEPAPSSSEELARIIKRDLVRWGTVVKSLGLDMSQ